MHKEFAECRQSACARVQTHVGAQLSSLGAEVRENAYQTEEVSSVCVHATHGPLVADLACHFLTNPRTALVFIQRERERYAGSGEKVGDASPRLAPPNTNEPVPLPTSSQATHLSGARYQCCSVLVCRTLPLLNQRLRVVTQSQAFTSDCLVRY